MNIHNRYVHKQGFIQDFEFVRETLKISIALTYSHYGGSGGMLPRNFLKNKYARLILRHSGINQNLPTYPLFRLKHGTFNENSNERTSSN